MKVKPIGNECRWCTHREQEPGTGARAGAVICSFCKKNKYWLKRPKVKKPAPVLNTPVQPKDPRSSLFGRRSKIQ